MRLDPPAAETCHLAAQARARILLAREMILSRALLPNVVDAE